MSSGLRRLEGKKPPGSFERKEFQVQYRHWEPKRQDKGFAFRSIQSAWVMANEKTGHPRAQSTQTEAWVPLCPFLVPQPGEAAS